MNNIIFIISIANKSIKFQILKFGNGRKALLWLVSFFHLCGYMVRMMYGHLFEFRVFIRHNVLTICGRWMFFKHTHTQSFSFLYSQRFHIIHWVYIHTKNRLQTDLMISTWSVLSARYETLNVLLEEFAHNASDGTQCKTCVCKSVCLLDWLHCVCFTVLLAHDLFLPCSLSLFVYII